jgi:hypothetical protein
MTVGQRHGHAVCVGLRRAFGMKMTTDTVGQPGQEDPS